MILDEVFYLLDIDETPLRALPLSAEYKLEDMQDSTNRLELRIPIDESGEVLTDQDIFFLGRRFSILTMEFDKDTREIILICDELQARLADVNIPTYTLKDDTLPEAMQKAVERVPGWTIGAVFEGGLNYNAELKNISSLFALRFLERQSGGRLFFDSGRKVINLLSSTESVADIVFRYGKNVSNITKTQTSPQATVLFAYGRDGMTIEAITGGKKYVEDFSWYTGLGMSIEEARAKFTKELVWEDDRYIYNGNLHRDAVTRLALLSQPQINYKLENAQSEGLALGMLSYVHDEELDIRVRVAVSKLTRSSNPEENEVELDYMPPSLGATIDNEYSGDTNTGASGETSFFLQKNREAFNVSAVPAPIITTDITVFSATAFEMGLTLMIEVTQGGLLEGYFTIGPDRLATEIKQTVAPGWYTIGLPFIATAIQEGIKTLRLYLTMATGAATVPAEKAEFFIKATGVYGGDSNEKPDQNISEDVKLQPVILSVTDSAIQFIDLPRRFEAAETVELDKRILEITENSNVFLDPPPAAVEIVDPFEDTQIRSEFADMRYYQQNTRPTQIEADKFIDELHTDANHFVIIADEWTVYMIAGYGSYLDVSYPTPGNPIISSDGDLYLTHGRNNEYRGFSIDWSVNNPYPKTETERYNVPDPVAPGEAGPPRRVQYETDYSMTETDIVFTPGANDRLTLTPVEEGVIYRVTRGAATTAFAVGFVTAAPQFNATTETLVSGFVAQDPTLLETEIKAPPGVSHLVIYEQAEVMTEIVVRALATLNLFTGEYTGGYFLNPTSAPNTLYFNATYREQYTGAVIPVTAGKIYEIQHDGDYNRTLFLDRAPALADTNENSPFTAIQQGPAGEKTVVYAPPGATHLFIFLSTKGAKADVSIIEKDAIIETIEWTEGTPEIPHTFPAGNVALKYGAGYLAEDHSLFVDNTLANAGTDNQFYGWDIAQDLTDIAALKIPTLGTNLSSTYGYTRIKIGETVIFETFANHEWTERLLDVSGYTGTATVSVGMFQPNFRTTADRAIYYGKVKIIK